MNVKTVLKFAGALSGGVLVGFIIAATYASSKGFAT